MHELTALLRHVIKTEKAYSLVRVADTWGSAPRPVGASMLIDEDGNMTGSVSGGCVENDVVKRALETIYSGKSTVMTYGIADEDAWKAGLSCGGKLTVIITPLQDQTGQRFQWIQRLMDLLLAEATFWWISRANEITHHFVTDSEEDFSEYFLQSGMSELGLSKETILHNQAIFVHKITPRPALLIIGVAHLTASLCELAALLGFKTIAIDPRVTFAQKTMFRIQPDELHTAYPSEILDKKVKLHDQVYCAIVSHDPKIDDDALKILLASRVGYIGALGSKKNHEKRMVRLQQMGFSNSQIERIHAPIGLDIGACGATEIALSIMAEIIKIYRTISQKN